MKTHVFAVLITGCLAAIGGASDAPHDKHTNLDGTWVVKSVLRDPREKNPDEGKGIRCVIKGAKLIAKLPGNDNPVGTLFIKIDPTKDPKTMDIRPEGERDTVLAIYDLKGDTLQVCLSPQGKERPAEFAAKPGTGHTLAVLTRGKP